MPITTSAADAGAVVLDTGSRSRNGGVRDQGGDSFADTLGRQMQPARAEAPQKPQNSTENKRESGDAGKPAGNNGVPAKGPTESAAPTEGETKAEAADASPIADEEQAEQQEPLNVVFALVDSTAPRVDVTEEVVAAEATASIEIPAQASEESGKILPQAATVVAFMPGAVSELEPGVAQMAEVRTGVASTTASASPVISPDAPARTAAALGLQQRTVTTAPVQAEIVEAGIKDAPESFTSSLADGAETATTQAGGRPEADRGAPVSTSKNNETLLQAMRLGLSAQPETRGGEKADNFAAALASLREMLPRGTDVTASVPNTAAPTLTTPSAGMAGVPAAPPASLAVAVPLGQPNWDQAMGERVVWMTRQGIQEAQIQLNPRDLGPVEVRVSVNQDQANVAFTAHTPAAREALEAALPRLREMLADSGLNLAQSDVSHQSPQQHHEGAEGNRYARGGAAVSNAMAEDGVRVVAETPVSSRGAVDFYA